MSAKKMKPNFLTRRKELNNGDWRFVGNGGRDILTRVPSGFVR